MKDRYWIVRGNDVVNKVIRECSWYKIFRINAVKVQQFMGDLPEARVTMKPPFTSTAVDYTGCFLVRASILTKILTTIKVYVAVFKCMSTGAIHLELVTDLTTEAFLAAFERFILRRGLCRELFSDNATCFEGADNELKAIVREMEDQVDELVNKHSVRWVFTTPRSPHAGGIYESAVKSMKYHLKRVLGETHYTIEQFWTILCKIEAILNSRPLTPLSDDPNDFRFLTPGHFLIGRPLVSLPQRNVEDEPIHRLTRWKRVLKIQQQFWKQWYHEYLHLLQTRPKGFRERTEVKEDAIVLLKDDNLPPLRWLMGRISKLLPGTDGVVRNVEVMTKNGPKRRHIKYLVFFPMEEPLRRGEDVREDEEDSVQ